jgi:hypothetical protein
MVDEPEIKNEIEHAKDDLRDALQQLNGRVEERVAQLRPDRGIRRHPVASACVAGALGFALGSDSGEVAMIGLLFIGAAAILARDVKTPASNAEFYDIQRI